MVYIFTILIIKYLLFVEQKQTRIKNFISVSVQTPSEYDKFEDPEYNIFYLLSKYIELNFNEIWNSMIHEEIIKYKFIVRNGILADCFTYAFYKSVIRSLKKEDFMCYITDQMESNLTSKFHSMVLYDNYYIHFSDECKNLYSKLLDLQILKTFLFNHAFDRNTFIFGTTRGFIEFLLSDNSTLAKMSSFLRHHFRTDSIIVQNCCIYLYKNPNNDITNLKKGETTLYEIEYNLKNISIKDISIFMNYLVSVIGEKKNTYCEVTFRLDFTEFIYSKFIETYKIFKDVNFVFLCKKIHKITINEVNCVDLISQYYNLYDTLQMSLRITIQRDFSLENLFKRLSAYFASIDDFGQIVKISKDLSIFERISGSIVNKICDFIDLFSFRESFNEEDIINVPKANTISDKSTKKKSKNTKKVQIKDIFKAFPISVDEDFLKQYKTPKKQCNYGAYKNRIDNRKNFHLSKIDEVDE